LGKTIQPDNAFLPAGLASQVTAPFGLSTFAGDLGPVTAATRRSSWRGVIGASGDLELFGAPWKWDLYGQESLTHAYTSAYLPITARFNSAIDAVRGPNGSIVCRSSLSNPNDGCVPFDVFGTGVNGPTAVNYIMGTPWVDNRLTERVVSATLRGDAFSTWAGPVSIATGAEHRREAVSGSNDPLSNSNAYFAGNYHASFGAYEVTEGFLEVVAPLAKDRPFAKSLDFNGAVRATDYSTSGYVTTWKAGFTYSPFDDLRFRMVRSRDIRAPNLSELFQAGQTQTQQLTDPTRANASSSVFLVTQGNTALRPEQADTWGVGVVLQPRFWPGFAASVDYYDIRIKDAISTISAQTEVNQCAGGNAAFCTQVVRNPAGIISTVYVSPINFAAQKARGIDFEASYRRPVGGGDLEFRLMATRYLENYFNNGISAPTDVVGTNGLNVASKNSLPKWRYLATVAWNRAPLSMSLTARGFSAGVQNTSYIECASGCLAATADHPTIDTNRVPGALYLDANITVEARQGVRAYLSVDNLLNKDPAQVAYGPGLATAPLSVNPVLFDVLGRTFRIGVRFEM
jgi:outer membrane receptor protein involved in Fe transport